jgi:hypothetical protein
MDMSHKKALVFFCNAYDELEELCKSQLSDYKINQIARLLRQFLFDDTSILSTAAGLAMPQKSKFSFVCNPYLPQSNPGLEFGSIQDGFYPEPDMPFARPIKVSRQDLGKQFLFEYKSQPYSLKQLVKYIANKEGGIHFDQTQLDIPEENMREAQNFLNVGGRAALTSMLKSVGLVVLDGLGDLRLNAEKVLAQAQQA